MEMAAGPSNEDLPVLKPDELGVGTCLIFFYQFSILALNKKSKLLCNNQIICFDTSQD